MMKIIVKSDRLVGDMQSEFNKRYPYLRLEFYNHSNKASSQDEVEDSVPIGRLWNSAGSGTIDINGKRTVSELEGDFRQLELFTRVLRQSGRSWITTSLTKDWTLAQQNEEGEMMSSIHEKSPKDELGWDGFGTEN